MVTNRRGSAASSSSANHAFSGRATAYRRLTVRRDVRPPERIPWSARLLTPIAIFSGALTVGSLLAFAFLRPALFGFYSVFGLSPEDVGVTESGLAARAVASAGAVCAILVGCSLVGILFFLCARALTEYLSRRSRWLDRLLERWQRRLFKLTKGRLALELGAVTLAILGLTLLVWLPTWRGLTESSDILATQHGNAGTILSLSLTAAVLGYVVGATWPANPPRLSGRAKAIFMLGIAAVVVLVITVSTVDFWSASRQFGRGLLEGDNNAVSGNAYVNGTLDLLEPGAEITQLQSEDPLGACVRESYPLILGRKDNGTWVLLYRPNETSDLIFLPTGQYSAIARSKAVWSACLKKKTS